MAKVLTTIDRETFEANCKAIKEAVEEVQRRTTAVNSLGSFSQKSGAKRKLDAAKKALSDLKDRLLGQCYVHYGQEAVSGIKIYPFGYWWGEIIIDPPKLTSAGRVLKLSIIWPSFGLTDARSTRVFATALGRAAKIAEKLQRKFEKQQASK